jgi:peptidoglycan/xylan/chitin deacetylase (PgdA/CDA1 family)
MSPWDWTWEDPASGKRTIPRPIASRPPDGQPPDRESIFRRRRAAAALSLLVVLVVLVAVLHSHGSPPRPLRVPAPHVAVAKPDPAKVHALAKTAENRAIASVLAYTPFVREGGTKGNEVALTFDDGPGPFTVKLVETLDKLRVQATFFAIGEEERYFSAGTLAELRSGDVIGDHTETHPMMAQLTRHDQRNELLEQIYRIQLLGGSTPQLFRPPYGSFDATTLSELRSLHLLMVLWSTDTSDYTRPGVDAIVQSALAGAHPGAIILMHDAGGDRSETIAALPAIVRGLRKRGLRPVTIPRLLLDDPPPHGQPIPKSLAGD